MERIKDALDKARQQQPGQPSKRHTDFVANSRLAEQPGQPAHDRGAMKRPIVMLDPSLLERNRIVSHNKNNPDSSVFDILRTRVLQKMSSHGWRTLGVISAEPMAGKTVVAINLAMSIARLPERSSLLVDLDLRRPSAMNYLGLKHTPSVNNLLQGDCELQDVLVYPLLSGFVVAGTHEPMPNSAEILASSVTGRLIEEVKNRYQDRIVIFDLPPLFVADDAIAVLPKLDCALLVVANGLSSRRDIEEGLRLLSVTNLVGAVLNKAQNERENFSYGYLSDNR